MVSLFILLSFVICLLTIPLTIKFSTKHNLYDSIDERKVHTGQISRLGGIGIFLGFFIPFLFLYFKNYFVDINQNLVFFIIGIIIIFLEGLFDDLFNLPPKLKLIFQVIAALVVILGGFTIDHLFFPPFHFSLHLLSPIITFIWIIGLTNAFNLIDGIDGLCGSLGCIVGATYSLLFNCVCSNGSIICFLLIASICGFLVYNLPLPKAKIFMGDNGSQFIGFCLAILPLIQSKEEINIPFIAIAFTILIPFFDTIAAIWRRVREKRSFDSPDAFHLHHKLMMLGFSNRKTLIVIILLQTIISILIILGLKIEGALGYIIYGIVFAMILFFFTLIHFIKEHIIRITYLKQ